MKFVHHPFSLLKLNNFSYFFFYFLFFCYRSFVISFQHERIRECDWISQIKRKREELNLIRTEKYILQFGENVIIFPLSVRHLTWLVGSSTLFTNMIYVQFSIIFLYTIIRTYIIRYTTHFFVFCKYFLRTSRKSLFLSKTKRLLHVFFFYHILQECYQTLIFNGFFHSVKYFKYLRQLKTNYFIYNQFN